MSQNVILITGASSGVGLSLVHWLKQRWTVVALARRIDRLRKEFENDANVHCHQVDLTDISGLQLALDEIMAQHGTISYLVNNAGLMHKAGIDVLNPTDLLHSFQLHAMAPLLIMQRLLPAMKAQNFGRIVNITSGAPLNCFPEFSAYSSTKAALNALTVTAAREHAEQNIRINLMSPGPVRTEMAPTAPCEPSICHPTLDYLLSIDYDGPTGRFFWLGYEIPLVPDLEGIEWLAGRASDRFRKVL